MECVLASPQELPSITASKKQRILGESREIYTARVIMQAGNLRILAIISDAIASKSGM